MLFGTSTRAVSAAESGSVRELGLGSAMDSAMVMALD